MNWETNKTVPPYYPAELVEKELFSGDFEDRVMRMMQESVVTVAKNTDELILGTIKQILTEHGIRNEYVLNEDFIVAAIREKMERQPGVDYVPVVHGKWVDKNEKPVPWDEYEPNAPKKSAYCSVCGEWLTASDEYPVTGRYCPNCGAKMDDPKGD